MYKPDWFDAAKKQRANEVSVDEIGLWCAKMGLGMGGGGQYPHFVSSSPSSPSHSFSLARSRSKADFFLSSLRARVSCVLSGQISRQTLTTQLIPQLRHLEIPPSYPGAPRPCSPRSLIPLSPLVPDPLPPPLLRSPVVTASLPPLSFLPFSSTPTLTRSLRNILSLTDVPSLEDEEREAEEDAAGAAGRRFFTEREEQEEIGKGEESDGEVEGDGVEEWDD